ncbi:MAG: SocA family protein [Lachnospiraceae bacterium]|nr:SocA family protein [Lachnospiraceae bacterium]
MKILFTPNCRKIIEGLTWVTNHLENCTQHTALKALFYADKFHIQKYGRPVTGDKYIKMPCGPVGIIAYNIMKGSHLIYNDILDIAANAFYLENKTDEIFPNREACEEWFSGTDLECLKASLDKCKKSKLSSPKKEFSREYFWLKTMMHKEIDYELIIDQNLPNRKSLIKYMQDTSRFQVV